jgi:aminopeptidase N
MTWKLTIPSWPDTSSVYALFGRSQQMTSLPLFYPALAVYEPGPAVGTGAWWMEQGSVRGDSAFNVSSFFVVTATLPSDQTPVTSGSLVSTASAEAGQTRYVWVAGPAREFLLHMSAQFASATTEAYGTRITSYWLPGQEAGGRAALAFAVAALRIYSDYYGPYPFRDMRLAPAPLSYRGMEYPQVNLLGIELYGRFMEDLEILVAHEVAHQWWYQIVHNDPVKTPWLDEAIAEYSVKLYYEGLIGQESAGLLQMQRWQTPLNLLVERNAEASIDRPVDNFENSSQYETIIYGKGALFYEQLRLALGDRQFKRFLQDYLRKYRYQIVDTDDWLEAVRSLQNPTLETLYTEWVEATAARLPSQSQQARDVAQP